MNRAQKTEFIESVRASLGEAPLVILTDFKGSTVVQMDNLRRAAEEAGASFQVVKNTLAKIAVADSDLAPLAEHFRGNIGVVFSGDDPAATAKMFKAQRKENEKLEVRAGFFEGTILDAKAVDAVADLPSREQLYAMLLGMMEGGPRKMVGVLQAPARDLINVIRNYARKLEEEGA